MLDERRDPPGVNAPKDARTHAHHRTQDRTHSGPSDRTATGGHARARGRREPPLRRVLRKVWYAMGPGFITGASDDDPSGIATYSQTGAQYGYGLLWTSIWQIPLLYYTQEAVARIGAVSGKGLASAIRDRFGLPLAVLLAGWWWWPTRSTPGRTSARSLAAPTSCCPSVRIC
ncbi:MAG: divalent metal cation transporter [Solirubrobacterales bacterium]|nr:divalent metal cation transporter [Solirubrobacterales bacterium]